MGAVPSQDAGKKDVSAPEKGAKTHVNDSLSNELIFAVVGHAGSGTSEIAEQLSEALRHSSYDVHLLKASKVISEWYFDANAKKKAGIEGAFEMQDAGDKMRLAKRDNSAVARALVGEVRAARANAIGSSVRDGEPVMPNGAARAYILDSLRHPEEVQMLRSLYQDAFVMVGVVCDADVREQRLLQKFEDAGGLRVREFMARDADSELPDGNGQLVAETFYQADYFINNSASRFVKTGQVQTPNPEWSVVDELTRLVEILTHSKIVRPSLAETAMYHAHGARMRSACLSRQVGAALVDSRGEVISTGCNEVPKAGGGVYDGEGNSPDFRCATHRKYCSSVREQNSIIDEVVSLFPELRSLAPADVKGRLRKSPLGRLLEFSRAVHAEMEALLAASRKGIPTLGAKMFVTTYPCHYCARHLVAAGLDEVQFIEPYPKSLATKLHDDAITVSVGGLYPSQALARQAIGQEKPEECKVKFVPFAGVAPKLYRRAFMKDRSLKKKDTGDLSIGGTSWGGALSVKRISYIELEAKLADV